MAIRNNRFQPNAILEGAVLKVAYEIKLRCQ